MGVSGSEQLSFLFEKKEGKKRKEIEGSSRIYTMLSGKVRLNFKLGVSVRISRNVVVTE